MNLEAIEQRCLAYLKQVSNPLVPLDTLMRYLERDAQCGVSSRQELLGFLREHELFRVIEPGLDPGTAVGADDASALGLPGGPYVILSTRVPTRHQMAEMVFAQFETMVQALDAARSEAQRLGDAARVTKVNALLKRAEGIREHLHEAFGPGVRAN